MTRTSIIPENREHWLDLKGLYITSTDTGTIFRQAFKNPLYNPYQSFNTLWHLKKARKAQELPDNPAMARGRIREPIIAQLIGRDLNRQVEPMKDFIMLPELRQASSYDAKIFFGWGQPPLELKSVSDWVIKHGYWKTRGREITYAGPRVELQLQVEMKVGNFPCIYLGVECAESGRRFIGYREPDPLVYQMIDDLDGGFWKAFDKDIPPMGVTNRKPKQLRQVA